MTDIPHKEHPVFIDAQGVMRRRKLAAALLAVSSVPVGVQVNGPNLTLTALSPSIVVSGTDLPKITSGAVFIEEPRYQKRRNLSAMLSAISSAPVAGPNIAIPTLVLGMQTLAPTIQQSTPIFGGQDLQSERDPEIWQPGRRIYLSAYRAAGTNVVIIDPPGLTLTPLVPAVVQSGVIPLASIALTLTPLAPVISQVFLGVVQISSISMQLTPLSPVISIAGPADIPLVAPALTLTALAPVISQVTEIGRATARMLNYKTSLRILPRG